MICVVDFDCCLFWYVCGVDFVEELVFVFVEVVGMEYVEGVGFE